MQRIKVDLPEPEGPMMTTTSCAWTRRLQFLRAWKVAEPFANVLANDDLVGGGFF